MECHGVDQLTAQQVERRLVIQIDVMKWVGDDLRQPHESGANVLQKKQVHGAAKQAEGKVQNTWGKVKDAAKSTTNENLDEAETADLDVQKLRSERKAS